MTLLDAPAGEQVDRPPEHLLELRFHIDHVKQRPASIAVERHQHVHITLRPGKENTAPCLEAGCQGGAGAEIDYTTLDVTQVFAVGLGNAASINGELLTMFAERQGGIYMNAFAPWIRQGTGAPHQGARSARAPCR